MDARTKITLAWELHEQGLSNSQIAKRLELNRETINRYVACIAATNLLTFLENYRAGQQNPRPTRQTPPSVKRRVWEIRERELNCCGQKIAYFLKKEHDIELSVPKIYEIISEKYQLTAKGRKKQKRGEVPEASAAREVIQMDTVHFGGVFAFTAVDIFSREADVFLASSATSMEGKRFLESCMPRRFGFQSEANKVGVIQTDGGSEFEGEYKAAVGGYCLSHRVARPYKKNEQSFIESFNRTVRSECLGHWKYKAEQIAFLQPQVERFLERYHYHRPHLGFDPMRPPLTR